MRAGRRGSGPPGGTAARDDRGRSRPVAARRPPAAPSPSSWSVVTTSSEGRSWWRCGRAGCTRPRAPRRRCAAAPCAAAPRSGLVDLDPRELSDREISLVGLLSDRGRRVLVLGDRADPLPTAAAVAAGAVGEVSRSAPFTTLVEALEAAALGRPVMSDGDRRHWLDVDRAGDGDPSQEQRVVSHLTPREHAVLQRLARGQKAAAIAPTTGFPRTVRSQIRSDPRQARGQLATGGGGAAACGEGLNLALAVPGRRLYPSAVAITSRSVEVTRSCGDRGAFTHRCGGCAGRGVVRGGRNDPAQ